MARFSDLPNEITRLILGFVQLEDLENFAQTSKIVSLIAKSFLKEHRRLIRRYNKFCSEADSGQFRDGITRGPIPALLREVLANPRIARYVRHIRLDTLVDGSDLSPLDEVGSDETFELYSQSVDLFTDAASQSELIACKPAAYETMLEVEGEAFILAILLPLLPNLTSMSIEWATEEQSCFDEVIQRASEVDTTAFGNLKSVCLISQASETDILLRDIWQFTALPSLRSLTAYGVSDDRDWLYGPLPRKSSHTTELRLLRCALTSKSLHNFLQPFDNLQSFVFENTLSSDRPFDPFFVRSAFSSQARTTLSKLTLLANVDWEDCFMGSLHDFDVLREVHTEWSFLVPWPYRWDSKLWPDSLRTVKLRDMTSRQAEHYGSFIKGVAAAQKAASLRLERMTLFVSGVDPPKRHAHDGLRPRVHELERTCKDAGISLIIDMSMNGSQGLDADLL